MPAPRATKAVIRNLIEAAQMCGVDVAEVVVAKDGSVRIIAMGAATTVASEAEVTAWDKATGVAS